MESLFGLFKKKQEKAVQKPEPISPQESQEKEQLSVIGNIRKHGFRKIRNLFFAMMLSGSLGYIQSAFERHQNEKNKTENIQDQSYRKMEEASPLDKLKRVLGPDELELMEEYFSKNYSLMLSQDAYLERVIRLGKEFKMTAEDVSELDNPVFGMDVKKLTTNSEYRKIIKDIKRFEPEGFQLPFSVLPLGDLELMKDSSYIKTMSRAAKLEIHGADWRSDILYSLAQDSIYEPFLHIKTEKNVSFLTSALQEDPKILYDTDQFPQVAQFLENSVIDMDFMISFKGGVSGFLMAELDKALSDEKNREKFIKLQQKGYSVTSFLEAPFYIDVPNSLFNDTTVDFFEKISTVVDRQDLRTRDVVQLLEYDKRYQKEGSNSIGGSWDDIAQIVKDRERVSIQGLLKRLQEFGIHENIYLPLIEETPEYARLKYGFLKDPALDYVRLLGYHKKPPVQLEHLLPRDQASWIMQTCRAMHAMNIKCSPENFDKTLQSIMETRTNPEVLNQPLFQNRNVVMLAHNEKIAKTGPGILGPDSVWRAATEDRFGKEATLQAIRDQNPSQIAVFRTKEDLSDLATQKRIFLESISKQKELTIFIDAHGSSLAVSFTEGLPVRDGEVVGQDDDNSIWYKEIAQGLIDRYIKHGISDRAIIINNACMNFEFLQNIYSKIDQYNEKNNTAVPLPLAIGVSEYGQYGFSDFESEYGSPFSERLLKNRSGEAVTVKNVIEIEQAQGVMPSNLSLFVPYKSGYQPVPNSLNSRDVKVATKEVPMQIADNNQQKADRSLENQA